MGFFCPECSRNTLQIEQSVSLGSDDYNRDVLIQIVRCIGCGFSGIAVYEESLYDSDHYHHDGYYAPREKVTLLKQELDKRQTVSVKDFVCDQNGDYYNDFPMKFKPNTSNLTNTEQPAPPKPRKTPGNSKKSKVKKVPGDSLKEQVENYNKKLEEKNKKQKQWWEFWK